jgi:hypothetical protein
MLRVHVSLYPSGRHSRVTVCWTCWRMRCACAHDIRIDAKMFMAEVCGHSTVRVRYRDMRLSRS